MNHLLNESIVVDLDSIYNHSSLGVLQELAGVGGTCSTYCFIVRDAGALVSMSNKSYFCQSYIFNDKNFLSSMTMSAGF